MINVQKKCCNQECDNTVTPGGPIQTFIDEQVEGKLQQHLEEGMIDQSTTISDPDNEAHNVYFQKKEKIKTHFPFEVQEMRNYM